jgi:tripartite-type tricarboxylate transporter receptor subunit TctC
MKVRRRQFLQLAGAAAMAPAFTRVATAQVYPTRPISGIVTVGAGGITDVVGRVVADGMRGPLGQPIIVENITGADGNIGMGRAARARPDGYTFVFGSISHVLNGAFYSLPYDVVNDFAPVAALATTPYVLYARKTMPAKDLTELIGWLMANPNRASMGVVTGSNRLLSEFLQKETRTQFALVPYRGVSPAVQDLVAGQIDLLFDAADALTLMRSGSIKAYAVTTDARLALAPDIPIFAELGLPALSFSGWLGLFAPKGMPSQIIAKLNAAAVQALADPAVGSRLADLGMEVFPREKQTPEALGAMVKADAEKWWPIIKELGIKAE